MVSQELMINPKQESSQTTVAFYTLGCRLNQAETAAIQNSFTAEGYRLVEDHQPADIAVINTCTVTANGDTDTRRLVNRLNRLNPQMRIALIGCQAQIQKDQLAELSNVQWVIGNAHKMDLVNIIHRTKGSLAPFVLTPTIPRKSFTIPSPAIDQRHTRANLKIQDGCDFFCTFCEIPYARGRARSREFSDIIAEAEVLVAAGHQEVVVTGINVGTYAYDGNGICEVVAALLEVHGLQRIRISSIEPTTIPRTLLDLMSSHPKFCRYLHIPLQSADNMILQQMKRKYSLEDFDTFLYEIRQRIPGICIGTDIIVGFPGETEESFHKTYTYLRDAPINYFHVFSYSPRHMAKSKAMAAPESSAVIQQRSQRLRTLGQRKRRLFYESIIGTRQSILIENLKDGYWTGLTDNYVRVKIQSSRQLANQMVPVKMEYLDDLEVHGSLVE
jgi:threonylcarbamoyladenosine tRNA methylthiotransferase MtaB